jgi:spore germination protein YaaH
MLEAGNVRMLEKHFGKARTILLIAIPIITLFIVGWVRVIAPRSPVLMIFPDSIQSQQTSALASPRLLHGKVASLGWIVGRDCQRSLQAYLSTASTNPDAALVGTGWVDASTGQLVNGQSNNCAAGSLSMDNVVQLVHSKGGMAYLTVTMETDGTAGSWTSQQQSDYIAKATTDQGYIDTIVHEVTRINYDGVIMDMEAGDPNYPNIQQLFAQFNQRVWDALKPLHKLYGIALIHKLSDHDEYYNINGFENWSLLAHSADFIVIMAVDQSYFTPGPTVSIPWLKQLLAYTLQTMPGMLPRIIWELPLYGATWRLQGGQWVFDNGVNYQDGVALVSQIPPSEIDTANSNLNDPTCAHLVYTDSSGVEHSLWYHTAKNLYYIITNFQKILQQVPQFGHSHLQIAVWYRATWEPTALWPMIDNVLPNA